MLGLICKYCGNEAFFILGKNEIPCCSDHRNKCNALKQKNSNSVIKTFEDGRIIHPNFINYTKKGVVSLRKGLTLTTSDIIKRQSQTYKKNIANGKIIPHFKGKKHSDEIILKMKLNPKTGGLRAGSGRGIQGWYKGYYCRSTWELAWLCYQLDNDIKVSACEENFEYMVDGKIHKYYPDFKIGDDFIEIKGYHNKIVQAKIDQFPKNLKLIMIEGKQNIKKYIDYAISNYGEKFWIKLYGI